MFSINTAPDEFETLKTLAILNFTVQEENSVREIAWLTWRLCFWKAPFPNVLLLDETENPAFSNSSDLKSFFEKLNFRDGSVQSED